jgi:excisionase family DNA binding protein
MHKVTEQQAFFSVSLKDLQKMIENAVQSAIAQLPEPKASQPQDSDLLTVADVAKMLKVAPISVYRYVKQENLPHIKGKKHLLFRRADVLQWFAGRSVYSHPATVAEIANDLKKKGGR